MRETETQVLVASIGNGHQAQRMQLAARLWARGIKVSRGVSEAWFIFVESALVLVCRGRHDSYPSLLRARIRMYATPCDGGAVSR